MIWFTQDDDQARNVVCIIGQCLAGPMPDPKKPVIWYCTSPYEQGQLAHKGINAILNWPPWVKAPWEVEAEARRKWEEEHTADADPGRE